MKVSKATETKTSSEVLWMLVKFNCEACDRTGLLLMLLIEFIIQYHIAVRYVVLNKTY